MSKNLHMKYSVIPAMKQSMHRKYWKDIHQIISGRFL